MPLEQPEDSLLTIKMPFSDVFVPVELKGEERLSAPFEYTVDLLTEKADVPFKDIIGHPVTVKIALPDDEFRYINGVVREWIVVGKTGYEIAEDVPLYAYQARLVPWLWPLTLTHDHRIFQEMTAVDIIEKVFGDLGHTDYRKSLKGTYEKRDYCVQYGESVFDFVSRLMEEEGIFYFFEHEDGKHTLVLADDPSAFKDLGPFVMEDDVDAAIVNRVRTFQAQYVLISTKYELDDYDFEKPASSLTVEEKALAPKQKIDPLEKYAYPGRYVEKAAGSKLVTARIEESEANRERYRGSSTCMVFSPGGTFKLKEHANEAFNDQEYQLRSVRTEVKDPWSFAKGQGEYLNEFVAAPKLSKFRPAETTPRPRIYGLQTAVVVGKSGEEIWTDKHGRIKVQFHWDRQGKKDENSSCWIRVAQSWAGKQWGGFILPRIGMEVLVSFLNGDPDRPLVTGAVYNGDNKTPYTLPGDQTRSTLKSRTSKGGEGFNEIRFEDKEEEEEVFIHGHRDMNVETARGALNIKVGMDDPVADEADMTVETTIGHLYVTVGSEAETGKGDMTVDVLQGKYAHTVSEGDMSVDVLKGKFDQSVKKDYTLKVEGNLTIEVTGDISIKGKSITMQSTSGDITFTSAANLKGTASASVEMKGASAKVEGSGSAELKGGGSAKVEGGGSAELKGGSVKVEGGSTAIKGGMVELQGGVVKIN